MKIFLSILFFREQSHSFKRFENLYLAVWQHCILNVNKYGVCSDEGLTLETSAKHHIPQATNIPYQPCGRKRNRSVPSVSASVELPLMLPSPFSWFTLERKDPSVSASVASVNQALTAKNFILNDELGGGGEGRMGRGALRKNSP